MDTFQHWADHLVKARNGYSRPIANNTYVHWNGEDAIAIQYHATDIIVSHRDGRIKVNSGGWRTVTTLARLREFTPIKLTSERGTWYVDLPPNAADPAPEWPRRAVLKPFHALDPGPEPVKPDDGCLAGTETVEMEKRQMFIRPGEEREGDVTLEHLGQFFSAKVERWVKVVYQWHEKPYWWHNPPAFEHDGDEQHRKQCPHCELFDRQHDAWRLAMEGERYGRKPQRGYRQMTEAMERYGTREAWQDAYIEDFRRVRNGRREHREWQERNRVLFRDGMEIDEDGYATIAEPEQDAADRELIAAQRRRVDDFVRLAIERLKAGELPMPSGGDCWYCCLSQVPDGTPMGDAMPTMHEDGSMTVQPNYDHLDEHIEEGYVVPSLLVNAMRETGYQDAGIYMLLGMNADEHTMGGEHASADSVARALRKYLLKRLVPQVAAR